MAMNISLRFEAIVHFRDGIGQFAIFDPEAEAPREYSP